MQKGSVSVYFVQSALDSLRARGIAAGALLLDAGIAPATLQSPHGRVTPESFSKLWLSVAAALDDELFGQDSRRMKVGSFAMLASMLTDCPTLGGALKRMARFFNLLLDDFHCALEIKGGEAMLTIRPAGQHGAPRVFGFETLLMLQHGLACWLVGRRIPVLSATFCYAEAPRSAEYQRMYSENLRFGQAATALHFTRTLLELPVIRDQQEARAFVRKAPGNIVIKYKNTDGLAAQIRRRLRASSASRWAGFDDVAAQLKITPATLRRRLDDEGQTFQLIKDQLRRDMAVDLLCHSTRSVADIAAQLGFAEPSAFHRAFKKWTGANPGQYRLQGTGQPP
jgi:AraC-like DNA-binding protein